MFARKHILILSFLLVYFSCKRAPINETGVPTIEIYRADTKTLSTLSFIKKSKIIRLELTEKSGIDRIEKILKSGDRLFIINQIQRSNDRYLLAFNDRGKFIWSKPANADGPGNFFGYDDFILTREHKIEVLDGLKSKIVRFDQNGNFLGSFRIYEDAGKFAKFSNGTYVCHRNNSYLYGKEMLASNLVLLDESGTRKDNHFIHIHPALRDLEIEGELFFPSRKPGRYFAISPLNDTVFTVSPKQAKPLFVVDYPKKELKEAALINLQREANKVAQKRAYNLKFLDFLNDPDFISKYDIVVQNKDNFWLSYRTHGSGRRHFLSFESDYKNSTHYLFDSHVLDGTHIFRLDYNSCGLILGNPYVLKEWLNNNAPNLVDEMFGWLEGKEPNPIVIIFKTNFLDHSLSDLN